MKYEKTVTGIFVDRPNRFIAHVQIENQLQTVHVKKYRPLQRTPVTRFNSHFRRF